MCLPEIFYVRTIMFSGTHFVLDLLRLASLDEMRVVEVQAHKLRDLFESAIVKELSFDKLMHEIMLKCQVPEILKVLGIFQHLNVPHCTTVGRFFESMGPPTYKPKSIVTLRDYRQVVLTNLLYTCQDTEEQIKRRRAGLTWTKYGFEYIADNIDNENIFIFPVDAPGIQTLEDRIELAKAMFKFINVSHVRIAEFIDYVKAWKPSHEMLKEEMHRVEVNDEFKLLLEIRENDKRGKHERYDSEMEYYENNKKIQNLFKKYGYFTPAIKGLRLYEKTTRTILCKNSSPYGNLFCV